MWVHLSQSGFQSQTRRLLPRNVHLIFPLRWIAIVSIADATLASPQPRLNPRRYTPGNVFQSQTRRLLPRNAQKLYSMAVRSAVSIADATLASPQRNISFCFQ